MARGTRKVIEKMQDKYVEARLNGKSKVEAKEIAGYSENTKAILIDRPGTPCYTKIQAELAKRGIDDGYLAESYKQGLEECRTEQGRKGDYNAYFKGLANVGYLLGYGKRENPQVAIQINNGQNPEIDPARGGKALEDITALLERAEAICNALEVRVSSEESPGVHAGDSGDENAAAHP